MNGFDNLQLCIGDLHSHCHEIGYGHGSLDDAFRNARMQLDFVSVTAHAVWHDMSVHEPRLGDVVRYHQEGFRRAAANWGRYLEITESQCVPGRFIAFPSFEWHSMRFGDHNVYFRDRQAAIVDAPDLDGLRAAARQHVNEGADVFILPHHIGYRQGYRGIAWPDFSPEFSPVVEILSMHGLSECEGAPYPYLHTMGPRDHESTMQYGLQRGNVFGVIGSTDHHCAHPGSFGHGRAAVWAEDLSRAALWDAIKRRRTYAISGDRIELAFALNDHPMGSVVSPCTERQVSIRVAAPSPLDDVELIYNNRSLHRWFATPRDDDAGQVAVEFEVGWGEKGAQADWDVTLTVRNGRLMSIEPRFRGPDIVEPQAGENASRCFSLWQRNGENSMQFTTRTWGNPTTTTSGTQGVVLRIEGDDRTCVDASVNGCDVGYRLGELREGSRTGYLGGFLTPAFCFHRASRPSECTLDVSFLHQSVSSDRDWYYVRVRQLNGQYACSSPIWVEAPLA